MTLSLEYAAELFNALKLASAHMACNEYDNRAAFRAAVDEVQAVRKKFEPLFETKPAA